MYALVDILGKQYKVEEGSVLNVDHLGQAKGEAVEFSSVLMVSDGEATRIGSPYVPGVSVRAIVEDHGRRRGAHRLPGGAALPHDIRGRRGRVLST